MISSNWSRKALQAAAAGKGSEAVVKLLLESGADPNIQGGARGNAMAAVRSNWFKTQANRDALIQLLLDYGATDS